MAISNYQHGFKAGVTIRGVPVEISHPGRVFWVGNNVTRLDNEKTSSDGNDGSFLAPFATLEGALDASAVVASRGDILFVRPGFTLSVTTATALNFDKAGVAIVGLGMGTSRPTITFTTASTATIPVTAANMAIRNFIFTANFIDIASCFTTTGAANFSVEDCFFQDTSAILNFVNLVDTSTVANAADGLYFARNVAILLAVEATVIPFNVDVTQARWQVLDNYIYTAAVPTALGLFDTATNAGLTNLQVLRNFYRHAGTDVTYGVVMGTTGVSVTTGIIADNIVMTRSTASSAAITVAIAASGAYRLRNCVLGTSAGAAAANRGTELDIIRQAALISA